MMTMGRGNECRDVKFAQNRVLVQFEIRSFFRRFSRIPDIRGHLDFASQSAGNLPHQLVGVVRITPEGRVIYLPHFLPHTN